MKKCYFLQLFLCFALGAFGQGSGSSIDFAGTSANEHINFGSSINSEIGTSSFTLELWVKPRSINGDPAIIANKDWDSGNNTGFVLALENGNEFTFNFRPEGGTRRDLNLAVSNGLFGTWQHIAVTVDRNGIISLYRNGELGASSANISADASFSIAGSHGLRMGQDGVGDYGSKFDGEADEFRIWNYARTEEQIRESMCRIFTGNEFGLIHRYAMDDATGNLITDAAGSVNGTFLNASASFWKESAAPLGNTSANVYPTSWEGVSLQMSSLTSGTVSLDSIVGDLTGMHLYRVEATPNNLTGTSGLAGNSVYFGWFSCNGEIQQGKLSYDYSNFIDPVINSSDQLLLFGRSNNASSPWNILNIENSISLSRLTSDNIDMQQEIILGNIQPDPCNTPSGLTLMDISYGSAEISWSSGGSYYWNLSYGPPGFDPQTGIILQAINQNPFNLSGLMPNTIYEVYIQDSCLGLGTSEWTGPFSLTTMSFPGNSASGTSLIFNGNTQYVSCGTSAILRPESAITYEAWIKPQEFQENWVGIFTNLQDNASNESGYGLVYYNGEVRAYMMTTAMGANSWNDAAGVAVPLQKWSHVACTYDGSFIRIYLNGVAKDSMPATGAIDWEFLPLDFRIGMFYDNNEAVPYRGEVDEIRVWNYARSVDEIRTTMCRKLQGDETGLLAYYPLNEALGNQAIDGSGQLNSGALTNMDNSAWKISGAGIGDTSVFMYPETWASQNFSLASQDFGSLQIALVDENTEGIQIYRVDQQPFFTSGLTSVSETSGYFGVVIAGQSGSSDYLLSYSYGGYAEALAEESNLVLFNRNNASENQWNIYPTDQDLNTHQLFRENVLSGREFYLGTQTGADCGAPSNVVFTTLSDSTVEVDWQTLISNGIIAEFGEIGFSLGSGIGITASQGPEILQPISPNTMYDFYIQNTCSESEQSVWVGPYSFFSVFCTTPVNPIMLDSDANSATLGWTGEAESWRIQWGPVGFTLGAGIQIGNILGNDQIISGLAQSSTYEFYIRAECGFGNSEYVGPFLFSTTTDVGLNDFKNVNTPLLLPNPASQQVVMVNPFKEPATFRILSLTGQVITLGNIDSNNYTLSLIDFDPGVYQVFISTSTETVSVRLISLP